jgi:ApaG protein
MTFTEISHDIKISVHPIFVERESDPINGRFVYAYFVTIENLGSESVQLMHRQWYIHDSNGESHEVYGEGVVGRQPVITTGEVYNYNSFCVLKSFEGTMEGFYEMLKADGKLLKVTIPTFFLRSHLMN